MALIRSEKRFKLVFLGCHSEHGKARSTQRLPCEQRFLSFMALSVYEVAYTQFLAGRKQINYSTDKPRERLLNAKTHAIEKPLLVTTECFQIRYIARSPGYVRSRLLAVPLFS